MRKRKLVFVYAHVIDRPSSPRVKASADGGGGGGGFGFYLALLPQIREPRLTNNAIITC